MTMRFGVEAIANEGASHEGRAVQRLRRAEHRARN